MKECIYAKKCGACQYQGVLYEEQLKEKQKKIQSLLKKFGKAEPIIGMEDPYYTGVTLAVLSVFYPFYGENIEIQPDFEQQVLNGHVSMKGHIRNVHILIHLIKIFVNKNVQETIRFLKSFKQ